MVFSGPLSKSLLLPGWGELSLDAAQEHLKHMRHLPKVKGSSIFEKSHLKSGVGSAKGRWVIQRWWVFKF